VGIWLAAGRRLPVARWDLSNRSATWRSGTFPRRCLDAPLNAAARPGVRPVYPREARRILFRRAAQPLFLIFTLTVLEPARPLASMTVTLIVTVPVLPVARD
jgi:hypothetical protein